jgi:hypothetical protein
MEEVLINDLRQACAEVCDTVKYFEANFSSASRTPVDGPERCGSIEQFVECRLNFEAFNIPLLAPYVQDLDGYLFQVVEVIDFDKKKKKFKEVIISLNFSPETYIGESDYSVFWQALNSLLSNENNSFKFSWACKKSRMKIDLL